MKPGLYAIVITGPEGVVMDSLVDLTARQEVRLAWDDGYLQELLMLSAVMGGSVECALEKKRKEGAV